ncbi:MAG: D-sedoheptulose 7-phosphate isomerase [Termitinemataceae bacterium]|nr:MAG: D-sedoheptulose 7-phosphate isomerase [Termitinemataceae bacterium]
MIDYLEQLLRNYPKLLPIKSGIDDCYKLLQSTFEGGGKLLLAGNGGSAADCDHIVGELMKSFVKKRPCSSNFADKLKLVCAGDTESAAYIAENIALPLPAINLCSHIALNTAAINDIGSDIMFAQSVCGYGKKGDTFLGISTSGNSRNIYFAMIAAKAHGLNTIVLTGGNGGKIAPIADIAIIVRESETYKIQELHLPIYHAICLQLEEYFFGH